MIDLIFTQHFITIFLPPLLAIFTLSLPNTFINLVVAIIMVRLLPVDVMQYQDRMV